MNRRTTGIWVLAALFSFMAAGCGTLQKELPKAGEKEVMSFEIQTWEDQGEGLQSVEQQAENGQDGEKNTNQAGIESAEDADDKENRENRDDIAQTQEAEPERVVLGDERFDEYLERLTDRRVALFSNHTGIVGDSYSGIGNAWNADKCLIPFGVDKNGDPVTYGEHILDALLGRGVNVTVIFCPEHGFRGTEDAGASVDDSVDEKTGVPILSLYGNQTHAPSSEDMALFDTLVIDMQDVGLRYYTYYLTMYSLMDACASYGKEVVLLDRPNPNGFYVDGPILQKEFQSGVGQLPLPIVYGMTWGELARMINGEGWLKAGKDACNLTVIPCLHYTHQTKVPLIRNPSPNIKDMRAVYLYASTCFFENTVVSVGRGTSFPFEIYGSPYLKDEEDFLFSFVPESMSGAQNPPFEGENCYGKDLRNIPMEQIWEEQIHLDYLIDAYQAVHAGFPELSFFGTPDKQGRYWVDKLCGTDLVRRMIEEGRNADEIKQSWKSEIDLFKEQRKPYLLYEE